MEDDYFFWLGDESRFQTIEEYNAALIALSVYRRRGQKDETVKESGKDESFVSAGDGIDVVC